VSPRLCSQLLCLSTSLLCLHHFFLCLRWRGFGMAVASAGPYANNLHVVFSVRRQLNTDCWRWHCRVCRSLWLVQVDACVQCQLSVCWCGDDVAPGDAACDAAAAAWCHCQHSCTLLRILHAAVCKEPVWRGYSLRLLSSSVVQRVSYTVIQRCDRLWAASHAWSVKMRPLATDVVWTVCWIQQWALQKCLN